MKVRRLIFRLSSIGDLVIASSVLATPVARDGVDWVIAHEFSSLLQGHPRIRRLWSFDRATGLRGWIALCRQLWEQDYDEIYDLHNSLRSKLARILFFWWGLRSSSEKPPRWSVFPKQRCRLYGFFILKGLWPRSWRPQPVLQRFIQVLGGQGTERPELLHFPGIPSDFLQGVGASYFCVMPGAHWPGKRWPVDYYLRVLQETSLLPVILGGKSDRESLELIRRLETQGIPHFSGVGRWSLSQVGVVLRGAQLYLGGDTGMAHLAEAVGVPAWVLFGPTTPDSGFGPWRKQSRSWGADLWCRPCGKDGRYCFRPRQRYLCQAVLSPETLVRSLKEYLEK